jgi:hypothetical protein
VARELLSYIAWVSAAVCTAYLALRLFWMARGRYKLRKAGPRPLAAARHRLWRDPGIVEDLDLAAGPGGSAHAPVPPHRFVEEHRCGSQPCV